MLFFFVASSFFILWGTHAFRDSNPNSVLRFSGVGGWKNQLENSPPGGSCIFCLTFSNKKNFFLPKLARFCSSKCFFQIPETNFKNFLNTLKNGWAEISAFFRKILDKWEFFTLQNIRRNINIFFRKPICEFTIPCNIFETKKYLWHFRHKLSSRNFSCFAKKSTKLVFWGFIFSFLTSQGHILVPKHFENQMVLFGWSLVPKYHLEKIILRQKVLDDKRYRNFFRFVTVTYNTIISSSGRTY